MIFWNTFGFHEKNATKTYIIVTTAFDDDFLRVIQRLLTSVGISNRQFTVMIMQFLKGRRTLSKTDNFVAKKIEKKRQTTAFVETKILYGCNRCRILKENFSYEKIAAKFVFRLLSLWHKRWIVYGTCPNEINRLDCIKCVQY